LRRSDFLFRNLHEGRWPDAAADRASLQVTAIPWWPRGPTLPLLKRVDCAYQATQLKLGVGHLMTPSERYRQHAAQCLRAAQLTRTSAAKQLLTDMAQRWNEMAERAERGPLEPKDKVA
jgi:hypothetical protein